MAAEIRTLTIKQPWAALIATCGKTVENRTWPAGYRGLLAIHAGAYGGWDRNAETSPVALDGWKRYAGTYPDGRLAIPLTRGEAHRYMSFGAVIAVAELAGCHHSDDCMFPASQELPGVRSGCSPWAVRGQWHWKLADIRPLSEPVRCRGMLGLWHLPPGVEANVREQVEELPHA